MKTDKIFSKGTLPLWIAGTAAAVACGLTDWYSDAVDYEFMYPDSLEGTHSPDSHIESVGDIWRSQCLHYLYMNGRFFVHFLVQLFCGLLGRWWFAVANGIVWGILPAAMLRVAGCKTTLRTSAISVTLALLLMYELRMDPPFQINYVWMSLMMLGFMLILMRRGGERATAWYWYVLSAVYCFLFGEGNEGFSFPVGAAVLVWAAMRRFRLSGWQWTAGIAFGIGALVEVAAPGNWLRMGVLSSVSNGLNRIEGMLPAVIVPAIYVVAVLRKRRGDFPTAERVFIWTAVITCYLLCFAFKASSGARMVIPANMLIAVLLLNRLREVRISRALCVTAGTACAVIYGLLLYGDQERSGIQREIYARYAESSDGTVYLDDARFARIAPLYFRTRDSYQLEAAWRSPGKGALRVRPERLRGVSADADTNAVIRFDGNVWLILASKSNPAEFTVKKTVLPGVVGSAMAERKLELRGDGSETDIVFDSIGNSRVGIYVNSRPYLGAEVVMDE